MEKNGYEKGVGMSGIEWNETKIENYLNGLKTIINKYQKMIFENYKLREALTKISNAEPHEIETGQDAGDGYIDWYEVECEQCNEMIKIAKGALK